MFGSNLAIVFSAAGFIPLAILSSCIFYFIYIDAKSKNSDGPIFWGLAVVVFTPIILIYLFKFWGKDREVPITVDKYKIAAGVLLIGSISGTIGFIMAPAGPVTSGKYAVILFPIGLVLGVILYTTSFLRKALLVSFQQ